MSQGKQVTSKKNDPLQAKKIFEDDIGDDFLSSWKPSTRKTDMDLDFGNENTPKAKKSSFSLDKFDVDFDFDGGFGNLSTFDVDMSDLDFRSPLSKTQKSKAKSQEKSQEKNAGFEFEFDFKGLDGFDLDSTLLKGKEEKKNPVQESPILPSNDKNKCISESKSKIVAANEEKKNSVPEKSPVLSTKKSESVSKRQSMEIIQNVNSKSESQDSATLKNQPMACSKFSLSKFNMNQTDSEGGVTSKSLAQSPCTSGSQHVETEQCKETSPDKQSIIEGTQFRNLHQTGYANTARESDHLNESEYSGKVEMSRSESRVISQNVDNYSENHDNGTVPKEPIAAHSHFKLSEFNNQEIEFQHKNHPKSVGQSQSTSGSDDVGSKQWKQATTDNPGFGVDTCFGNLLQAGDAKDVKQTYNLTESKYFDKAAVSQCESKGSSQNVGNSLGANDDVTVPKQPMLTNKIFKLSELSIEEMDSHHGLPPKSLDDSPCTSGSQEIGNKHRRQSAAEKQGIAVDTCFENILQTGESNTMKWTSNVTDSICSEKVASSPTSSYYSGSRDKLLSHKVLSFKDRLASKDPQGNKDQFLVQTGPLYKKMQESDSASKNSSPTKVEHLKHNPGICAVSSSGMMIPDGDIHTLAQKDVNDNTEGQMNQCRYEEDFGENQSTLPTIPDSFQEREITSHISVNTKFDLQPKKNITDQTRKKELNLRTEDSVSKPRGNILQGLNKICQPISLANDGGKLAMERNSSVEQSKSCLDHHKSHLSEVSETTENKNSVENNTLQETPKLIIGGRKSMSIIIPQKHTQHLPTFQASRPKADDKSKPVLKRTNEKLVSPKPTVGASADKPFPMKVLSLSEQKNTLLSPLPPLKRKPMEMYEMLKQKHQEAKDLFVRAIVMNNWLLMLNHPMQEEKFQAIEKYVACKFPDECTK